VPFAIMSLVGGVLADRYSPKVLLVFTQGAGLIAVSVLVASVLGGAISLRIVYIVGFALASFEAIASPARFALLPQLLPPARLNRATAIVYGTYQLSQAAGPGIAGTLIVMSSARFEGTGGSVGVAQVTACGIAFSVTAFAYGVALLFLAGVRTMKRVATPRPAANESMPRSIAQGFATIWRGRGLRLILLVTVVTTMLVEGALRVGIPVRAEAETNGGALLLGELMSSLAIGGLIGTGLASMASVAAKTGGYLYLGGVVVLGALIAAIAATHISWLAALILCSVGLITQFLNIHAIAYAQTIISEERMGRAISVVMFARALALPAALLLGGFVAKAKLEWLFAGSGTLTSAFGIALLALGAARALSARERREGVAPAGTETVA
jgi:MFS family permease